MRYLGAVLLAAFSAMTPPAAAEVRHTILSFEDLEGWADDDHSAALEVFLNTCRDLDRPEWRPICRVAEDQTDARAFFEVFFRPVLVEDGEPMLFTGYFEPELTGSLVETERFKYPLYSLPPDIDTAAPWYSRAEIEEDGVLQGQGLEIAWVDNPVDAFFLHVQGSGRIRLPDGSSLRVGYAGKNGHDYRSIGRELVRRGIYEAHQVSAQVIRNWVHRNPAEGLALLRHNPSYVFFRVLSRLPAHKGPLGAMNRSITEFRSIAVDPAFTPLGAPVWIEKDGNQPMRRLMVAQDTGSAIKGPQRADIFFGTGAKAGREAGTIKDPGRMVVLLPIQRAYALAPEV